MRQSHVFQRSLTKDALRSLIQAFIHSRLDYTPFLFLSFPTGLIPRTLETVTVTVTVTKALVLRPLLEDRGRITELIRILVPIDRMKQKMF